jgi:hypothetical protein
MFSLRRGRLISKISNGRRVARHDRCHRVRGRVNFVGIGIDRVVPKILKGINRALVDRVCQDVPHGWVTAKRPVGLKVASDPLRGWSAIGIALGMAAAGTGNDNSEDGGQGSNFEGLHLLPLEDIRPFPRTGAQPTLVLTVSRGNDPEEGLWIFAFSPPLYLPHVPLRPPEPQGLHDLLHEERVAGPVLRGRSQNPAPRQFTFQDPEKIRELARRGEALGTLEAKEELEREIENGRGGVYLRLTPEQYRKLW